jgi:hypothetical protein
MTTIDLIAPRSFGRGCSFFPRQRLIAVGIGDVERDSGVLAWACTEAVPGVDIVQVVHAYAPTHAEGSSWGPMESARQVRRRRAERVVARGVQRLRFSRPGLRVDGTALGGESVDVLAEVSEFADLVVVGEDDLSAARPRTGWRVRGSAQCPVVSVPPQWRAEDCAGNAPVTVLVDDLRTNSDLPVPLLVLGFAEAERRGTSLCVAQFWTGPHESGPMSPSLVADRQAQLDEMLQIWRGWHPTVGVMAELLLGDVPAAARRLRTGSQLVVVASDSPHALRLSGPSEAGCCPTVSHPVRRP